MKRRRRTHLPVQNRTSEKTEIEVLMLGADLAVLRRNNITVPGGYITRAQVPRRLSELVSAEGAPTSVVIIEPTGARHTDVLHPPPGDAKHPVDAATARRRLHGGGFLPGEEVQLFGLVSTTRADPDGHAEADSADDGEITLMFGAISGTVVRAPGVI